MVHSIHRWMIPILAAGCLAAQVTYTKEVSRILQTKCQQCHRPNDIAPFSLDTFEKASDYKDDIKRVIEERKMPPWKPVAGHGEFAGDFSLTQEEKDQLSSWVNNGAPKGEDSDMPEPLPNRGEWVLGEPDLVLQIAESYTPPLGKDMYRCFVLPTDSVDERFVTAVDILPGERRFVHHVILYLDTSGKAEELDANEEGPGYTCFGGPGTPIDASSIVSLLNGGLALGGWAPGTRPAYLPAGVGAPLPAKARVVMQVHYYARGGTAADQTRVGLYFTKGRPERRLIYFPIVPLDSRGRVALEIPAGVDKHAVTTEFMVPPLLDNHVVNVFPHMHLLGRQIKLDLIGRDGREQPMIYIDNWDFNWQGPYTYTKSIAAQAFSRFRLSCTYDNTESNPRNPNNPVKTVRWGEGTEDEMCVAFLGVTLDFLRN